MTPPDAFGPFRVLHQIGNGALGPVFRAYDSNRDRLVAVKVFRLDLPPDRVHRLVAEFEQLIATELQHPVIAAPRATGIDAANNAFLAQDFAAADSLDIVLRENGRTPLATMLRVGSQLADALDYAAARHVLHGALHPRDILLSEDDIRIVGIGVSRALERAGVASPVRRPYSAPERINEEGWDQRADVFSLAAIVYEMLCGRRVTGTGSEAADGLTEVPGCDVAALQRVFALALAADPAYRFDTAAAFTDALKAAGSETADDSEADVAASTPKSKRPRSRLRVVAAEPLLADVAEPIAPETEPSLPLMSFGDELEGQLASEPPPKIRLPIQRVPAPTPVAIETATSPIEAEEVLLPVEDHVSPDPQTAEADASDPWLIQADEVAVPDVPLLDVPDMLDRPSELPAHPQSVDEPSVFEELLTPDDEPRLPAFLEPQAPLVQPASVPHSPIWPIGVAAAIGIAVGFGVGYTVAIRDRVVAAPPAAIASATPPTAASVSAGNAVSAVKPATPSGLHPADDTISKPAAGTPSLSDIESRAVATSSKPAAPVAAPSTLSTGRLVVRSTPAGARVLVDGKDRGQTPVAIPELSVGEHRIRVVRDGYTAAERRVVLTTSRPVQGLSVPLAREPRLEEKAEKAATVSKPESRPSAQTGALIVESRPQGATVVVDGRAVGTTPISLGDVRAGNHSVQLERDGYRTWAASVSVSGGEQNRVTASLEK